jgi:NAD(P)-dependent dehydrogenase (short-subunit alcohol dehydrogenase family)
MDKYIVITGASTGIGEDAARLLAAKGFKVFAGVRMAEAGERIKSLYPAVEPLIIDVTKEDTIQAAVETVNAKVGKAGLYALINNAGIVKPGPVEFLPLSEWREQMEVNLIGQIAVTQAFMPLIRAGKGRVLFVSSVSGEFSAPLMGPYSASKFALEAMIASLRMELSPWGIPVVSIRPGQIKTPIWHKTLDLSAATEAKLGEKSKELYGARMDALKKLAQVVPDSATPVAFVSETIYKALVAAKPRTFYRVGKDAKIGSFLNWLLPQATMEKLVQAQASKFV